MEELLRLLTNVFPSRVNGQYGVQKIFPYHKSVLDWLADAGNTWGVDADRARFMMGMACFESIMAGSQQAVAEACKDGSFGGRGIILTKGREFSNCNPLLSYSLRYSVAHLSAAQQTTHLEQLILDFVCFWPSVYAAGKCTGVWKFPADAGLLARFWMAKVIA